eukprot:scpid36495/ scgid27799/ 
MRRWRRERERERDGSLIWADTVSNIQHRHDRNTSSTTTRRQPNEHGTVSCSLAVPIGVGGVCACAANYQSPPARRATHTTEKHVLADIHAHACEEHSQSTVASHMVLRGSGGGTQGHRPLKVLSIGPANTAKHDGDVCSQQTPGQLPQHDMMATAAHNNRLTS